MFSSHFTTAFYIFSLLTTIYGFSCGSDKIQNDFSQLSVSINCPGKVGHIDQCCQNHDNCYARQAGREHCDNVFCECMKAAARGTPLCEAIDSPNFCNLVRTFGAEAYKKAGK